MSHPNDNITLPDHKEIEFFRQTKMSDWSFINYINFKRKSNRDFMNDEKAFHSFKKLLEQISKHVKDEQIKERVIKIRELIDKEKSASSMEAEKIITNNYHGSTSIMGDNWKVNFSSDDRAGESSVEIRSSKTKRERVGSVDQRSNSDKRMKSTKTREYLLGDAPKKLTIIDNQQFKMECGRSITNQLLKYRESAITRFLSNNRPKSEIQELAVNCIYLIEGEQQDEYNIDDDMWNCIKDHINEVRCSVERDEKDEEEEDNFRKEKMCPIFKLAKKSEIKEARIRSHSLVIHSLESSNDNQQMMAQSLCDVINGLSTCSVPKELKEDLFSAHVFSPALKPFLPVGSYIRLFGCEHESRGSKERRGSKGRIPDLSIEAKYKENSQMMFMAEIKSPLQVKNGNRPDFIKLCNLMKDETDHIIKSGIDCKNIIIYGMTVEGFTVKAYAIDLSYSGIYFVYPVNDFLLPTNIKDLSQMDDLCEALIDLNIRIKNSVTSFVRVMRTQDSKRDNSPNRKLQFVVKSFSSPKRSN